MHTGGSTEVGIVGRLHRHLKIVMVSIGLLALCVVGFFLTQEVGGPNGVSGEQPSEETGPSSPGLVLYPYWTFFCE